MRDHLLGYYERVLPLGKALEQKPTQEPAPCKFAEFRDVPHEIDDDDVMPVYICGDFDFVRNLSDDSKDAFAYTLRMRCEALKRDIAACIMVPAIPVPEVKETYDVATLLREYFNRSMVVQP